MKAFLASCGIFVIVSLEAVEIPQRSKPHDHRVDPRLDRSRDEGTSRVFGKRDLRPLTGRRRRRGSGGRATADSGLPHSRRSASTAHPRESQTKEPQSRRLRRCNIVKDGQRATDALNGSLHLIGLPSAETAHSASPEQARTGSGAVSVQPDGPGGERRFPEACGRPAPGRSSLARSVTYVPRHSGPLPRARRHPARATERAVEGFATAPVPNTFLQSASPAPSSGATCSRPSSPSARWARCRFSSRSTTVRSSPNSDRNGSQPLRCAGMAGSSSKHQPLRLFLKAEPGRRSPAEARWRAPA